MVEDFVEQAANRGVVGHGARVLRTQKQVEAELKWQNEHKEKKLCGASKGLMERLLFAADSLNEYLEMCETIEAGGKSADNLRKYLMTDPVPMGTWYESRFAAKGASGPFTPPPTAGSATSTPRSTTATVDAMLDHNKRVAPPLAPAVLTSNCDGDGGWGLFPDDE